jgi:DNA-binding NarL/FixJ family response regulator
MSGKIGIVTAEGYPLMRTGIERIVIEQEDMKLLGEATSVCHATQLCKSLKPDILLLAPNLADYDPAESVLRVQSACPTVKVLILSFCDKPASARAALNAGADGYVLKSEAIEAIVQAIRTVAQGAQWISPSLLFSQQQARQMPGLSKRQKHVLGLMITGKTDRQISQILYVHERTVRNYLRQIYNKLGVDTRVEAVAQAFRLGLVS